MMLTAVRKELRKANLWRGEQEFASLWDGFTLTCARLDRAGGRVKGKWPAAVGEAARIILAERAREDAAAIGAAAIAAMG